MSRVNINVQEEIDRIYNGSIQAFHCINLSVNTNYRLLNILFDIDINQMTAQNETSRVSFMLQSTHINSLSIIVAQ